MKIKKVIELFQKVLRDCDMNTTFICNSVYKLYGFETEQEISQLFSKRGYYRSYIEGGALKPPKGAIYGTKKFGDFKRKFLKQEIKELTALLKKGYTDI